MIRKLLFFAQIIYLFSFQNLFAANGSSTISGNWGNSAIWLFSGTHRVPACGDTVTIPPGITVTVNSQTSYTGCSSKLIIGISGTLSFTNGNKLDLPCGSNVTIYSGGYVQKTGSGGGNSNHISICGVTEWSAGDGTLSGPAVLGGGSPLPVSLLSFDASYYNSEVKLQWTTASEINNDYFVIEHSGNGLNYSQISKVKSQGNNNEVHSYSITDRNFSKGINYYQLIQVDYNGKKHSYPAIALKVDNYQNASIKIYSLPGNRIALENINAENSKGMLAIHDLNGKTVYENNEFILQPGSSTIQLSCNQILQGFYVISLIFDNEVTCRKLLVQ